MASVLRGDQRARNEWSMKGKTRERSEKWTHGTSNEVREKEGRTVEAELSSLVSSTAQSRKVRCPVISVNPRRGGRPENIHIDLYRVTSPASLSFHRRATYAPTCTHAPPFLHIRTDSFTLTKTLFPSVSIATLLSLFRQFPPPALPLPLPLPHPLLPPPPPPRPRFNLPRKLALSVSLFLSLIVHTIGDTLYEPPQSALSSRAQEPGQPHRSSAPRKDTKRIGEPNRL